MYIVHTLSRVIGGPSLEYTSTWLQLCEELFPRVGWIDRCLNATNFVPLASFFSGPSDGGNAQSV